jgi:hypothetical protein
MGESGYGRVRGYGWQGGYGWVRVAMGGGRGRG